MFKRIVLFVHVFVSCWASAQVTPNINSGNPAVPFPQFLDYGPGRKTLASVNAPGVTHAEMEQRTREAWQLVCNNTSPYPNTVVAGVQYLYPTAPNHCTCVEGDGYYLLGAALMGDKSYFDGYYMWTHDRGFNGVKRFIDGVVNPYGGYSRGLSYSGGFGAGTGVLGEGISGNSATDGDVDVALALLVAYKQWGEKSGIILTGGGWGGKEINYKEEALNYIKAMVDTSIFPLSLPEKKYVTGVVGLDGYIKRGDSWGELTSWAEAGYRGMQLPASSSGANYIDYNAPGWFKAFRTLLEEENERPFLIEQYKRGEASSDWLMGLHHSKGSKNIPYMGKVESLSGNDFKFSNYISDGEDFRAPWRTIMNYVWHDNPTYTWNPATHQVEDGKPNTYEYEVGLRYSKFLKNRQGDPWNHPCRKAVGDLDGKLTFKGTYTHVNGYTPEGDPLGAFPLSWIHGTGAPSAIAGQDFELMGEMFRHCVIVWDAATGKNLDSRPIYFHEWFRLAGLLTLAGNWHSPINMVAKPNLKVYHKLDKTYAFTGDQITFTVSYRNYGSVDGTGTVVKFGIPKGYQFVSSTKGSLSGDSVVWNVGTAKGFKTGGLAATMDSMKVTLLIGPTVSGRYCTNARVSCTNGLGWTSNEYPNNITSVMERNCIDVVKRALKITKTADRKEYNPGQDIKYKIKFENSSDAGWINGGRSGVRLAFAHEDMATPSASPANVLKYRLFHDAAEPYIDYGNYRVSYFMNDPSVKCYAGTTGCTTGWTLQNTIAEGVDNTKVKVTHETIVPGEDANGKWNQRIVLQFSPQLATVTQHLQQYSGNTAMIHEGGMAALRGVWRLFTSNYSNVDWTDDWSWEPAVKDGDAGLYFPITDDYTDPNKLAVPINSWHKSACETAPLMAKKVLVEEWDGYTWRRVLGNGPSPGRDLDNVIVTDTLPAGVTFKNFIRQKALGIDATTSTIAGGRTVITWTIPKMQVNQKDSLLFTATVSGTCPNLPPASLVNKAWIKGATESAIFDGDTVNVSCVPVAICPAPTTLTKTSDKPKYQLNEQVKYSLEYTQTQGSIANPDLSLAADWVAQSGTKSVATFAAGGITLPGMGDGANIVLTHDYSYGTNTLGNGIEGTFQFAASEKQFALVVRHTGVAGVANGVYVNIQSSGAPNPTTVDIYSGTTKLNATSFSIPFSSSTYDFRIQLNGGTLSMWLVASGGEISGAASIVQTGIPVRAGFAGVSHGAITGGGTPYGTHKLINWRAHVDAAFNVQVTDSIPKGIITPTGITPTTGVLTSNAITWTLATGKTPMLYNAKASLAWQGTYNECAKVTNKAFVNTLGITGNQLGVCYDITCGTAPVCVKPNAFILRDTTLTPGMTTTLRAVVTPPNTSYIYNWYRVYNNSTVLLQTGSQNILTVSDTGRYVVRVADKDTSDAQCYRASNQVKVSYGCIKPQIANIANANLTAGSTVTLTAVATPDRTGYLYSWYKLPNVTTPLPGSGIDKRTFVVSDTGTYRVRVTDQDTTNTSCYQFSNEIKVSYGCVKPTLTVRDTTLELGKTTTLTVLANPKKLGYFYSWYKVPDLTTTLSGSGLDKSTITVSDTGKYIVRVTDMDSTNSQCFTFSDTIRVKEGCTPPVALITNTAPISYCATTNGVTLTAQTVAGMDYQWFKGTQAVGTNSNTLANADSGTYTVRVAKGACADTSTSVKVIRIPQPLAEIDTVASNRSYCIGTPGGELTAKTAGQGATYLWLLGGTAQGNTSATLTPATQGSWQVVATANGCSDTSLAVVVKEVQVIVTDIQIAANRTEACVGTPINVSITNKTDGTVQWYQDNVLQPFTGNLYTFNFAKNTHIKAYLSTTLSCANPKDDSASVDITLNTIEASIALEVDKLLPVCEGEILSFVAKTQTGVTSGNYVWTVDGEIKSPTDSLFTSTTLTNRSLVKVSTFDACTPSKEVSDTLTVRLTPKVAPYVTLKPMGSLVCAGQNVTFRVDTLQGGGDTPEFEWYVNGKSVAETDDTLSLPIDAATRVYVKLTSNAACADPKEANSEPIVLDITPSIAPSISIVQTPNICPDQTTGSFTISYKQGEGQNPIYKWYVNDDPKQSTADETFTFPLTGGETVYAVLVSDLSCRTASPDSVSNKVIYKLADPITLQLYNNINNAYGQGLCRNATPAPSFEVLSNQPNLPYEWRINSNVQSGNGNTIDLPSLNDGDTIRVRVALAACPNLNVQDWMTVTVDDRPKEGFRNSQGDIPFCTGFSTTLIATEDNPNYTYTWYRGDQVLDSGQPLLQYTITQPGGYRLDITNNKCTIRAAEVRVRQEALDIEASADPTSFVPGDVVKAKVTGGENFNTLTYTWTPASVFQPSSTDREVTLFPQETMTIKVVVTAPGGCIDSSTVLLTKMDKLFIPNAITPETGDQNAFWDIKGTEAYQELEVRVYNRWGSLVHEQRGYSKPWDGTLNGKPLPTGTYYYVLKHAKFDKPKAGDLTIVR